ncbi:MAG: hypothetical protein ACYTE6_07220 [Planctomycetota bacterium]|jgi:type II secretory pathway pseudopilin PulG
MSRRQQRQAEGFTIVEILVVVGVLALLLGLLLPALSGAQKKAQKLREFNALKQVDLAWKLYANASGDRAVPGFLETDVQARWRVSFEYRNREVMPPAPIFSGGDPNVAGPWTWRLLPYMDFNYDMVHGHVDELFTEGLDLGNSGLAPADILETATGIAFNPGFGYNAHYIGGWWQMIDDLPRYRFYDATVDGRAKSVVRTSVAQIKRSSEVITFCSSALLPPGTYRRTRRDQAGFHWVSPPMLGLNAMWTPSDEMDPTVLKVIGDGPAPIGRYNNLAAVLHADGHTSLDTPGALLDMRRWIDAADIKYFEHQ